MMIFKVVTKFEVISSLTIILNPKIFQWVEGPQQARADRRLRCGEEQQSCKVLG
jgi:hypothetical protein